MKRAVMVLILIMALAVSVQAQQNDEAMIFKAIELGRNLFCSDQKLTEFLYSAKKDVDPVQYLGGSEGFEKAMNLYYGKISSTIADFGFGTGGGKNITYSWAQYYIGVNELLAMLKTPDDKRRLLVALGDVPFRHMLNYKGDPTHGATMMMAYFGALYQNFSPSGDGGDVSSRILKCDRLMIVPRLSEMPRTPIYKKLMNGFFSNNTALSMQAVNEVNPKMVPILKRMFCN